MKLLLYFSNFMIPMVVFYIVGYGLLSHTDIFDAFTEGASEGFRIVLTVMPTLIGLMLAIGLLRSSGVLEWLSGALEPVVERVGFPSALVPLTLIKMFSSSAAVGLMLDVFKHFGTDSYEGMLASVLMCCSETIFYTISVYFMATGDSEHPPITRTGWTLAGALFCTLVGVAASVWICGM